MTDDLFIDACAQCGGELPVDHHPRRMFCDKACNNAHFNGLTAAARAEARAGRTCAHCGETFDASRRHQLYCGLRCQAYASVARRCGQRTCARCGEPFRPKQPSQKYCGQPCYRATRRGE